MEPHFRANAIVGDTAFLFQASCSWLWATPEQGGTKSGWSWCPEVRDLEKGEDPPARPGALEDMGSLMVSTKRKTPMGHLLPHLRQHRGGQSPSPPRCSHPEIPSAQASLVAGSGNTSWGLHRPCWLPACFRDSIKLTNWSRCPDSFCRLYFSICQSGWPSVSRWL